MTTINSSLWHVYILQCNDGTLYTGICINIGQRLHQHNALKSGARYTRSRRPVKLVYSEQALSRSQATRREYEIKRMRVEQKRALIHKYQGA